MFFSSAGESDAKKPLPALTIDVSPASSSGRLLSPLTDEESSTPTTVTASSSSSSSTSRKATKSSSSSSSSRSTSSVSKKPSYSVPNGKRLTSSQADQARKDKAVFEKRKDKAFKEACLRYLVTQQKDMKHGNRRYAGRKSGAQIVQEIRQEFDIQLEERTIRDYVNKGKAGEEMGKVRHVVLLNTCEYCHVSFLSVSNRRSVVASQRSSYSEGEKAR